MIDSEKPIVEVFKVDYDFNHPYPWMFRIKYQGKTHEFAGIRNKCSTKRQAAIRGWWRARWMMDGTYDQRYK